MTRLADSIRTDRAPNPPPAMQKQPSKVSRPSSSCRRPPYPSPPNRISTSDKPGHFLWF
ncbi:hypothetical protein GGG16DRAFT_119807 [Schizophyllum commune]